MKKMFVLLLLVLFSLRLFANPDAILGIWANSSNRGHIEIYKVNGRYYGKIIWLKHPYDASGKPKVDFRNPNQVYRNQLLLGMVMLRDFEYEDEEWKGGKIYNPQDGKEYNSYIKLTDEKTMSVRGYIGIS